MRVGDDQVYEHHTDYSGEGSAGRVRETFAVLIRNDFAGASHDGDSTGFEGLHRSERDDTGAEDTGSAYVFNATTGALVATLNNPTPAIADYFGSSVAVLGNTAVVGAGWGAYVTTKPELSRQIAGELDRMIADGSVRPIVGSRFPLARAADAMRLIDERGAIGKVVLDVPG